MQNGGRLRLLVSKQNFAQAIPAIKQIHFIFHSHPNADTICPYPMF